MLRARLLHYRKHLINVTIAVFFVLESISGIVMAMMHTHGNDIFWFDVIGISIANLIISSTIAVIFILVTEYRLFGIYDPGLKLVLSRNGTLEYINKSAISFFRLDGFDGKERSRKINQWLISCKGNFFEKPYEKFEYKTSNRSVLFTKIIDKKRKKLLLFGTDISVQKTNEAEIHKLLAGMEQSANSVIITDPDGKITYVNKAFEKMTGYAKTEIIGKTPSIMKSGHHTREFYDELWETITGGETWHGNFLNKRKSGVMYWEDATITPVIDENAELYAYIAIKEDITSRIDLEKELRLAKTEAEKASDLKSEFLANISHEIRTPLNGILGLAEILLAEEKEQDRIIKLNLIRKSGEDLLELMIKILDLAKIEAERMTIDTEIFSIRSMLKDLENRYRPMTAAKGIKLAFNTRDNIPSFFNTGRNQIRRIIDNILENSLKFTDEGFIRVDTAYSDGYLSISIEDSGAGISDEIKKKIFESFQQGAAAKNRKYGGTGLGLTIAERLAHLLGGKITVDSIVGKGSTFEFSMPILPVDIADAENGEAPLLAPADTPAADNVAGNLRFNYDTAGLSETEIDSLSEILLELKGISADKNFDNLLEMAEKISQSADSEILKLMASDLRRIWELIDFSALKSFIASLQRICGNR